MFQVERDAKIGKLPGDQAVQQKLEILMALTKLGDDLTTAEKDFLEANSSENMQHFHTVSQSIGMFI